MTNRSQIPILMILMVVVGSSAIAQDIARPNRLELDQSSPPLRTLPQTNLGDVSRSSAGQVGKRQTRETVDDGAGIKPMSRITSRIQNRVQSRIRNRVDSFYSAQSDALSSFAAADAQSREATRRH
jgi:hypothetical protein